MLTVLPCFVVLYLTFEKFVIQLKLDLASFYFALTVWWGIACCFHLFFVIVVQATLLFLGHGPNFYAGRAGRPCAANPKNEPTRPWPKTNPQKSSIERQELSMECKTKNSLCCEGLRAQSIYRALIVE